MFSLYGYEETIRNIYRMAHPFISDGRRITTSADLRSCYLDFLQDHQPYMPVNRHEDVIVTDPVIEDALVAAYGHNATLNDLGQSEIIGSPYSEDEKARKAEFVRNTLDEFRNLDEALGAVFDLAIHSIVIRPSNKTHGHSSYGGSSSAAIGTIWLALGPTVTRADIVEMLLHEMTHHLLFIDERNYPHFDYDLIADEKSRAFSAILNLIRPIDKVVHSIVVATELIIGRNTFLPNRGDRVVHPSTEKMIVDTMAAQKSIMDSDAAGRVLRPRTREILTRCSLAIAKANVVSACV